jgi:TPR repeat protein
MLAPLTALILACFIAAPAAAAEGLTLAALAAQDPAKARAIAEPLAAKGDSAAQVVLGRLYEQGLGVRPDIGLALEHYSAAAVNGSADAQIALGRLAYEGGGVYPDYERAAGWFRLAAAQGDPRGEVRLGRMLADGRGVRRDAVAAAHHFARAAAKKDADGLFYLGLAFLRGDGVPLNYERARRYFAAASALGHGEAAYHLALMYDSTALGRADPAEAARYMRLAATRGHAPAYAAMGLIVHRGDAPGAAIDWFERGANAGDAQAALLYAVALSKGDGRPKDIAAAALLARRLATAPETAAPIRAQAERLQQTLERRINGPITLRE